MIKNCLNLLQDRILSKYLLACALIAIATVVMHHYKPPKIVPLTTVNSTTAIESHLKDIQKRIDELRLTPQTNESLEPLEREIKQLIVVIKHKLEDNLHEQRELIITINKECAKKFEEINQELAKLQPKKDAATYRDASALPFQILSIDSIQQIPVATASYDFKTTPLERGDTLGGWMVKNVSFAKQELLFENKKHERVLIALERSGQEND